MLKWHSVQLLQHKNGGESGYDIIGFSRSSSADYLYFTTTTRDSNETKDPLKIRMINEYSSRMGVWIDIKSDVTVQVMGWNPAS
jgi:hypothetical protein